MSRGIQITEETYWSGATWAADHVMRLTLHFLPEIINRAIREELNPDESWRDADLTTLSSLEFQQVATAAERGFTVVKQADPNSEWFHDPAFFAGFLERFQAFLELLRIDPRMRNNTDHR